MGRFFRSKLHGIRSWVDVLSTRRALLFTAWYNPQVLLRARLMVRSGPNIFNSTLFQTHSSVRQIGQPWLVMVKPFQVHQEKRNVSLISTFSRILPLIFSNPSFTLPPAAEAAEFNLTYVPSAHGYHGPLTNSFVKFISPAQKPWLAGLASLGVPTIKDGVRRNFVGQLH